MRLPQGEGVNPLLAMNLEGKGAALWSACLEGETHILGKPLDRKDSPGRIIYRTAGSIHHLQVAVDRRGNLLVLWLHESQGLFEILAQAFDIRSQSWEQEPVRLGPPSTRPLEPRLAVNHREHAMALWAAAGEGLAGLVACHYLPSERAWSDQPVPVAERQTTLHRVAMDDAGNALALWIHSAQGTRCELESAFYDVRTSDWSEPQTLARAEAFHAPQLAMAGDGEALAAWCQGERSGIPRLFAKAFQKGRWENEVERLDPEYGQVHAFSIALGGTGRAALLSLQKGPDGYQALARVREDVWSLPSRLGAITRAPLAHPHLVLGPTGAAAIWTMDEGQSRTLCASVTGTNLDRP